MIKVREAVPEDKEGWNDVAGKSPSATYAHTWEWKEIIENGLGNKSICLVAEQNDDIVGIYSGFLKSTESKNFLVKGRAVLFSPLTTTWDYGGPSTLPGESKDATKQLLEHMHNLAKKNKAISIRLSPYPTANYLNILGEMEYRKKPRKTIFIDLMKGEKILWDDLNKKTRNQVRQSQNNGLNVKETADTEFLYHCLTDTARRTGMELPSKKFYDTIMNKFGPKGMARIHVVEKEGNPIGASLCFYYKKYLVTRYYTALSEHLNERPYHALIWHIIADGCSRGLEVCDLGGLPEDPENGIYKFKMGWGGDIVDADWYIRDIYLKSIRRMMRKIKV
jgi:lipid II:glycine glycyltransferase (peptidoglycan interpeptide bridge formation enzyme)